MKDNTTDNLATLRQRLLNTAQSEGLLDITFGFADSPVGSLLVAATDQGIVRVAFDVEDHDSVLQSLADTVSPRIMEDARRADNAKRQLDEYFTSRRRNFELEIDLRLARGDFRREALDALRRVEYGTTLSYAGLAALAGNPTAVRAAASACSHNPLPLIIPCHRIVRTDGSPGRYLGGEDRKQLLLDFEQSARSNGSR